jgi:hypothetical protein
LTLWGYATIIPLLGGAHGAFSRLRGSLLKGREAFKGRGPFVDGRGLSGRSWQE